MGVDMTEVAKADADAEEADFLRRAGVAEEHLPREEESE